MWLWKTKKIILAAIAIAAVVLLLQWLVPRLLISPALQESTLTCLTTPLLEPLMADMAVTYREESGVELQIITAAPYDIPEHLESGLKVDIACFEGGTLLPDLQEKNLLPRDHIEPLAFLLPGILIPKGNPGRLRTLADLTRPELRIGWPHPDRSLEGRYIRELLDNNGLLETIEKRAVVCADGEELEQRLLAGDLDAALGWSIRHHRSKDSIDLIRLDRDTIPRIEMILLTIPQPVRDPWTVQHLFAWISRGSGHNILLRHQFLTNYETALKLAPKAVIGGPPEIL